MTITPSPTKIQISTIRDISGITPPLRMQILRATQDDHSHFQLRRHIRTHHPPTGRLPVEVVFDHPVAQIADKCERQIKEAEKYPRSQRRLGVRPHGISRDGEDHEQKSRNT